MLSPLTSLIAPRRTNTPIYTPPVSDTSYPFTRLLQASMSVLSLLLCAIISLNSVAGFTSLSIARAAKHIDTSICILKARRVTTAVTTKLTMSSDPISKSDHILFDMPVSNNGARCRIILYKKAISQDQVEIISPVKLGGLKSPDYLALSPNGLMPCLSIQKEHASGIKHISESDTIARYLLSEYSNMGPSFLPENPRSNQIARWHDVYLTTIQGCLVSQRYNYHLFQQKIIHNELL